MSAIMFGQRREEEIDKITKLAREALKSEDKYSTWYYDLIRSNGKRWAIVFAWMDYDGNDDWSLYGKVAFQPTNSLMQEYDIDWLMPSTDSGDVDDTELKLGRTSVGRFDISWLYKQWERIRKEYVDNEEVRSDMC